MYDREPLHPVEFADRVVVICIGLHQLHALFAVPARLDRSPVEVLLLGARLLGSDVAWGAHLVLILSDSDTATQYKRAKKSGRARVREGYEGARVGKSWL